MEQTAASAAPCFDDATAAVQELLAQAPAVAAAVVQEGRLVYSQAAGRLPSQAGVLVDVGFDETMFMVASISKTMNGLLAMLMKESGELDLDQDISTYLGVTVRNPHFDDIPITARMLLWHTSSLVDSESAVNSPGAWKTRGGDCPVSLEQYVARRLVDRDSAHRLWCNSAKPGAPAGRPSPDGSVEHRHYHYSNAGMTLLGRVLEKAAGKAYEQLVQERIFDVLGMTKSKYSLATAQQLPDATLAEPHRRVGAPVGHYGVAELPAAGLRTTAGDLARFLAALTDPSRCPISPESLREMLPEDCRMGLGWWGVDFPYGERGGSCFAHGGLMEGVRTHIYYWPQLRAGAVVLTNAECNYNGVKAQLEAMVHRLPNATMA